MLWYLIGAVDFFIFAALISKLRDITTLDGSPVISNTGKWGLLIASLLFFIPLSMLYFKLYPVSRPLHFIITLLLWLFTVHGFCLLAGTGKILCSREHPHGVMGPWLQLMIFPILITLAYWVVKQELQQSSLLNGWSILLMVSISGASLLSWQLSLPWLYKLVDRAREGQS